MIARGSGRTLVKICGLGTAEAVRAAAMCGADLVGFVFAPSRRKVTAEQAAGLAAALGETAAGVRTAGVFVNPGLEELERTMETVRLDVIQLHGDETPDFCRLVKARFPESMILKALRAPGLPAADDAGDAAAAGDAADAAGPAGDRPPSAAAHLAPYAGAADAFLLDTPGGGTGRRFAWDILPAYTAAATALGVPLFVAGGLDPDNVAGLIRRYRPAGVDVSSGVETGGSKDAAKMAAFIERVRTSELERA